MCLRERVSERERKGEIEREICINKQKLETLKK